MILSKREQNLAIGAGIVVGVLLIYWVIIGPCVDQWYSIQAGKRDTDQQLSDAKDLFARKAVLQKVWTDMQKGGLKDDASQAEDQALSAVLNMATTSKVNLTGLKPERSVAQGKFQVIGFAMTGSGSMQQISQLVWLMESTTIPMQMNDLQITPRHEATDDLSVRLTFTTLCQLPDTGKPDKTPASSGEKGTGS
jgi:type II secretory pathway component PulM